MQNRGILIVMGAMTACSASSTPAPPAPVTAPEEVQTEPVATPGTAEASAERWLGAFEAGEYAETWEQASPVFQEAISKGDWMKQLQAVRQQLGDTQGRELVSSNTPSPPPGAAGMELRILIYSSSFSAAGRVSESVTLARRGDGPWQVAGYFVK